MTDLKKYAMHRLGPRVEGGTYHNYYWNKTITVEQITWIDDVWEITERDVNGTRRTHTTAWDWKKDRVINQPKGE